MDFLYFINYIATPLFNILIIIGLVRLYFVLKKEQLKRKKGD